MNPPEIDDFIMGTTEELLQHPDVIVICVECHNKLHDALVQRGLEKQFAADSEELERRLELGLPDAMTMAHRMLFGLGLRTLGSKTVQRHARKCVVCALSEFDWVGNTADIVAGQLLRKN